MISAKAWENSAAIKILRHNGKQFYINVLVIPVPVYFQHY